MSAMAELRSPHGGSAIAAAAGEDSWLIPMRKEMRNLEDKISRQLLRFQDQSQRLLDMMLEPLDAKVAVLEGKCKGNDGLVAELTGGLRGLQEQVQMQVQRNDATEARFQRWRKSLEADLVTRFTSIERAPAKQPEVVTHTDLADVAGLLKQELRKLLHEAVDARTPMSPTRDEVDGLALELRQELHHEMAAFKADIGRDDLLAAAENLRSELRRLTEASLSEGGVVPRNGTRQADLERQEVEVLIERATQSKQAMEEVSTDIRHLREELRSRGLLGGSGPWAQPPSREEVQLIAEQACSQSRGLGAEEIGFVVRELEERVTDSMTKVEQLFGEAAACRSMSETLAVVQDTINLRLEAMEQRQRSLRDEVRGFPSKPDHRERAWQATAVEQKDLQYANAADVQLAGKVAQRLSELERAGFGEQLDGLLQRVKKLESAQSQPQPQPQSQPQPQAQPQLGEDSSYSVYSVLHRLEVLERQARASATGSTVSNSKTAEVEGGDAAAAAGAVVVPKDNLQPQQPQQAQQPEVDLHGQVVALWNALAEVADLAGTQCSRSGARRGAGSTSASPGASASLQLAGTGAKLAVARARDSSGSPSPRAGQQPQSQLQPQQQPSQEGLQQQLATEAMIGAVKDAVAAVSECRGDVEGCQKQMGTLAAELLDLRGDWAQLRTRMGACEKGLGELRGRAATAAAAAAAAAAASNRRPAADSEEEQERGQAPTPSASPRTVPTRAPEVLHPGRVC